MHPPMCWTGTRIGRPANGAAVVADEFLGDGWTILDEIRIRPKGCDQMIVTIVMSEGDALLLAHGRVSARVRDQARECIADCRTLERLPDHERKDVAVYLDQLELTAVDERKDP